MKYKQQLEELEAYVKEWDEELEEAEEEEDPPPYPSLYGGA